ncbi:hypothetical protein [Saccharopolyspora sp. NPDC002686]|uniref:hypothetical protein n=1 Tax=Saccharopolyspora sp. NPDC002686 TaxID=3154541 RepID=UPI00331FB288
MFAVPMPNSATGAESVETATRREALRDVDVLAAGRILSEQLTQMDGSDLGAVLFECLPRRLLPEGRDGHLSALGSVGSDQG